MPNTNDFNDPVDNSIHQNPDSAADFGMEKTIENDNFLLVTPEIGQQANKAKPDLRSACRQPQDADWGIDFCTLSIPVTDEVREIDCDDWQKIDGEIYLEGADNTKYSSNFSMGYANLHVIYFPKQSMVHIRHNPARLLSPKSLALLPPDSLVPMAEKVIIFLIGRIPVLPSVVQVIDGTFELVENWEDHVRISRLDCARNFNTEEPELIKTSLLRVTSSYQKLKTIFDDSNGWTLANRTKSVGQDRLYDKSAELRDIELPERMHWTGTWFRFEAQLQKDRLKKFNLHKLSYVNDERVWEAISTRWKATKWGVYLPGDDGLISILNSIKTADQYGFLGFLTSAHQGLLDYMDEKLSNRYRRLCKKLNVTPGQPVETYSEMTRRLSLFYGRVVSAHMDEPECN